MWVEEGAAVGKSASAQHFTVRYDDGQSRSLKVQYSGERVDRAGFAGPSTTLVLPEGKTQHVKIELDHPEQLVMSEVMFWHAELLLEAAEHTQRATAQKTKKREEPKGTSSKLFSAT